MSSVCLLSVSRVYCDKTVKDRIMQFSLNVAQCLISLHAKCDDEIRVLSIGCWVLIDFAMLYLGKGAVTFLYTGDANSVQKSQHLVT